MYSRLRLLSVLLCLSFPGWGVAQWDLLEELASQGFSYEAGDSPLAKAIYNPETEVFSFSGGAKVRYAGMTMYAEQIDLHRSSLDLFLKGDVRIYREELVFQGGGAVYNLQTGRLVANDLASAQSPLFFEAEEFRTQIDRSDPRPGILETDSVMLTTHDSDTPNYRLEAREVRFFPEPENRVEMKDVGVYVGDRRVFWLPYLSQSLDAELGWYFEPGYKSNWGAYLQSEYGILWEDHTLVKYQLDGRSRRGLAAGVELHSEKFKDQDAIGSMKFYYANDLDPTISNTTRNRTDVNEDRYRFNLQHRIYLPGPDESSFYVDFDINKLSDEFIYEDFFPNEFEIDPNPDNLVNIVKRSPKGTLSLLARMNLNEFFRSDERLPELALDVTRQPVLGSNLFYEGETSLGAYRERLSEPERDFIRGGEGEFEDFFGVPITAVNPRELRTLLDELQDQVDGYSFGRFHTYHELAYPISLFNAFHLVPRTGLAYTHYFDIDSGNPEVDTTESRALFHAGMEGSFKLSRVYRDVRSDSWGLDGLRHIVQPYFDYSFLSGQDLSGDVPRIDRLTPTTRLRPLDIGRFTAVDDLAPWNILRLGVRNVFQTKRDGETYNWLTLDTYFDTYIEDPEFSRTHSNLFNEILWQPVPWLRLELDTQFPVFADDQEFVEFNSYLHYLPTDDMEFSIGHRFLNDHPFFGDSNLVDIRYYARLSENWGFGIMHRYELDDNTLEVQQYTLHRDLASWTASLGAIARDNRGERDYGVVFALNLKDFPRVRLPLSFDPTSAGN